MDYVEEIVIPLDVFAEGLCDDEEAHELARLVLLLGENDSLARCFDNGSQQRWKVERRGIFFVRDTAIEVLRAAFPEVGGAA